MASASSAKNQKEASSVRQKVAKWSAMARKWVTSKRPSLLEQIAYWALVVIAFVVGAYFLFGWMMGPTGGEKPERIDITRMALTVAAGFGGLVALVVAYRKQRDAEEGRFVERFGAAAEQLGHTDVAVRMAGVYAMASVADRTKNMEQRQQCVDVLCGYLRLPYDPQFIEDHQTMTIVRNPERDGVSPTREIHFQYRQNDREVRKTIIRVIADHLRREDSQSWSKCSFDFTNVLFEEVDFTNARFEGEHISFSGARFSGENTWFSGATFSGERTSFERVTFDAESTSFERVTFDAENTSFVQAVFSAENTSFEQAVFSGERASFERVTFDAESTSFERVTFDAENTSFEQAVFSGERTSFERATFDGKFTQFRGAVFSGGWASFEQAVFSGKLTQFYETTFSGRHVLFYKAVFSGERIDFCDPRQWNPAPKFSWDGPDCRILKPINVAPDEWPPTEQWVPVPRDS